MVLTQNGQQSAIFDQIVTLTWWLCMPNYVMSLHKLWIKSVNACLRYRDSDCTQNGCQSAILYADWYIRCMWQWKRSMDIIYTGPHRAKPLKWPPTSDLWPNHETNARKNFRTVMRHHYVLAMTEFRKKSDEEFRRYCSGHTDWLKHFFLFLRNNSLWGNIY